MLKIRANRAKVETESNASMQREARLESNRFGEVRLSAVLLERADVEMALVAGFTMAEVAFMLDLTIAGDAAEASAEAGCGSNVSALVCRSR